MKVVKLNSKSDHIQITPKEALQDALNSEFETEKVIILLYGNDEDGDKAYQFWRGGTLSNTETLWHIEQHKTALLEGRLEE